MRNVVSGVDTQKSITTRGVPYAAEYYVACGELFGLVDLGQS